jgi:PAS domain S-box-containing protein
VIHRFERKDVAEMEKNMLINHQNINNNLMKILNLLHDGIYISDSNGVTLLVNKPYERLTGISAAKVIGKNVLELKESGVFSSIVNPEVVRTAETVTSVQEVNGRKVVLHGHPVLDEKGSVALVVTFVRDITVFSRLKEEIASQKSLVDYYQKQVSTLNPEDVFLNDGMVAASRKSKKILKSLENIAPTDATILILGETGVGKDVLAKRAHRQSLRASAHFLKIDCSAIPENLVESELFGYAPGAFSGARSKGKQGFFERADGGTLFLDEVGELSLGMQTKLLRAIHDQEVIRVGSTSVTKVDVRIIAATNQDLEESVAKGTFRSDLFYRLKVAVVRIPPLRERKDDILPLMMVFLHRFNKKYGKNLKLSTKAENMLINHDWPGNVREMENMIHSLVVKSLKDRISYKDLPSAVASGTKRPETLSSFGSYDIGKRPLKEIISNIERELINEAMTVYKSVGKVAEVLQVDRSTVFRKTRSKGTGRK